MLVGLQLPDIFDRLKIVEITDLDIKSLFQAVRDESANLGDFSNPVQSDLNPIHADSSPQLTRSEADALAITPEISPSPIDAPVRFGKSIGRLARRNPKISLLGGVGLLVAAAIAPLSAYQGAHPIAISAANWLEEDLNKPTGEIHTLGRIAEGVLTTPFYTKGEIKDLTNNKIAAATDQKAGNNLTPSALNNQR